MSKDSQNRHFLFNSLALIGGLSLLSLSFKTFKALYPFILPTPSLYNQYKGAKAPWVAITGSSDGLGRQFAFEFSKKGFNILLFARNQAKIKSMELELQKQFPNRVYKIILADFKRVLEPGFFLPIEQQFKELNIRILINNVGVTSISSASSFIESEVRDQILINLYSPLILTGLYSKSSPNTPFGVINIGSALGSHPLAYLGAYSATKAGLEAFTESLIGEIEALKVRVFCLTPYYVSTKMTGYPKEGVLTVSAEDCVKGALKQYAWGKEKGCGNWKHEILMLVLRNKWAFKLLKSERKKFYKDLIDRKEKIMKKRRR